MKFRFSKVSIVWMVLEILFEASFIDYYRLFSFKKDTEFMLDYKILTKTSKIPDPLEPHQILLLATPTRPPPDPHPSLLPAPAGIEEPRSRYSWFPLAKTKI